MPESNHDSLPGTLKPGADGHSVIVLVVEDDDMHGELVANVLCGSRPPFDLLFAQCVKEAVEILSRQKVDCVLLDHNLPDGVGPQLLTLAEQQLLETPVLAFSTSSDPEVVIDDLRAGCTDFIVKKNAFKGYALRDAILRTIEKFTTRSYRQSLSNYARKMFTNG